MLLIAVANSTACWQRDCIREAIRLV